MQRLTVLIGHIINWHKKLKQKLAFIIMSEQCQIKYLAIFRKVKESNTAIKKNLGVYKASLQAQQDNDNKDEKSVLVTQVVSISTLIPTNTITIKYNNDNLDKEYSDYINAFIKFQPRLLSLL